MSPRGFFVLLALAGAVSQAGAAERWLKVATPHFELYTNGGDGSGKRTALFFEQVRAFFLDAHAVRTEEVAGPKVRIIGFKNRKTYEPFKVSETAAAYYLNAEERDYIVLGDINAERHEVAVHEYTHLMIQSFGLKNLPSWLNEGLAEVYSTLRPTRDDQVRVGDIPGSRLRYLQGRSLIPLVEFLEAGRDSPLYNRRKHAGVFYAQSWALTHMLLFSEDLPRKMDELLPTIAAGVPSLTAIENVYGMDAKEIENRLGRYRHQQRYSAGLVDAGFEESDLEPTVEDAGELETEMLLARLLGYREPEQAEARYQDLAERYPEAPEPVEALGYLRMRADDRDRGVERFRQAAALGSTNARMLYSLSLLDRSATPEQRLDWLTRSLELAPGDPDALTRLGFLHLEQERWSQAVITLRKVTRVENREDAFRLYHARAYALARLTEYDQALTILENAERMADHEDQLERVASLRMSVQLAMQPSAPPDEVAEAIAPETGGAVDAVPPYLRRAPGDVTEMDREVEGSDEAENIWSLAVTQRGELTHLECLGATAKLHLETDAGRESFLIDDPSNIVLEGDINGPFEFTCGPQNGRPVAIRFEPADAGRLVRGIEFLGDEE